MKRLGIIIGLTLCSSAALADRASTTAPDFVDASPRRHIDRSLVASPDGDNPIDPYALVAFSFDGAQLSEAGYAQVDTTARWLKQHPRHKLVLEGHTDARGLIAYNEDLAMRRIAAVRQRLLQHGISSDRLLMITFGDREAMALANPLHPADRKVVMYATELSPRAVIAMVREERPAIVASWTERGALMQMRQGLEVPTRTIVSRR